MWAAPLVIKPVYLQKIVQDRTNIEYVKHAHTQLILGEYNMCTFSVRWYHITCSVQPLKNFVGIKRHDVGKARLWFDIGCPTLTWPISADEKPEKWGGGWVSQHKVSIFGMSTRDQLGMRKGVAVCLASAA